MKCHGSIVRRTGLFGLLAGGLIAGACDVGVNLGWLGAGGGQAGTSASSSMGGAGGADGAGGGVDGCAPTSSKAETKLDIFAMIDQSASMTLMMNGGGTRWTALTRGLSDFVSQPQLDGVSLGLGYFPVLPGCPMTCSSDSDCASCGATCDLQLMQCGVPANTSCNPSDYAKPEVGIAPLPSVSSAISTSLSQHMPTSFSPFLPALAGAIQHASTWATAHPSHRTIVVFANDGNPNGCNSNLPDIFAIAAAGAMGTPPILTYVIGVGTPLPEFDGIAAAGGTMKAFIVDDNLVPGKEFLDAMNAIRSTALGCSYVIPKPAMWPVDYSKVGLQYTPGGGMPGIVPRITDKAACPVGGLGWYYDNNAAPTEIILCDGACTQISQDPMAQLEVLLGC